MKPDFVAIAPCVEADPWLFDQNNIDLALPALDYCRYCPFWNECDEWVQPKKNSYDGVVGGRVWKNGKVLVRLDESSPNRLLLGDTDAEVGATENTEAMGIRGSELPRD
jgi:hypothetical protein